jgi:hypothetical protein
MEIPEARRVLQRPPHCNDEPAAAVHRPSHLTSCGRFVWKELQSLLTEDDVEPLSFIEGNAWAFPSRQSIPGAAGRARSRRISAHGRKSGPTSQRSYISGKLDMLIA